MANFKLEIITPHGRFFTGEVEIINVFTESGQTGIMAEHTPMLVRLDANAALNYKVKGKTFWFKLANGLLYVDPNGATITVERISARSEEEAVADRAMALKWTIKND